MIKLILILLVFSYQVLIIAKADTLLIEEVTKVNDITLPTRSMTMQQVKTQFGEPLFKKDAVGNPPITKWHYKNFIVYFEKIWVIQAVTIKSDPTLKP